jgi:hypothetical protein
MVGAIILKIVLYFGVPYALGWISRMGWEKYTDHVEVRNYRLLEQKKRVHLLENATSEELLDQLSKRRDIA